MTSPPGDGSPDGTVKDLAIAADAVFAPARVQELAAQVAQGPLSGPAALPLVGHLGAAQFPGKRPQGRRAGLALRALRYGPCADRAVPITKTVGMGGPSLKFPPRVAAKVLGYSSAGGIGVK